jgi:hypothetical protein
MTGRFTNGDRDRDGIADDRERGAVATREEPVTRTRGATAAPVAGHETAHAAQRDRFGGFSWGADFFGWLVAVGVAALLTAIVAAAGAATGLTDGVSTADAQNNAEEIGIGSGIALLIVLAIAYYAGGYVAGRMSRFDGGRQGLGVWLIGLVITLILAAVGAIAGSEYNLLGQLNLPRIPIDEGSLATGAAIALAVMLLATALAAIAGGKVGERYHHKVDRVGLHRD